MSYVGDAVGSLRLSLTADAGPQSTSKSAIHTKTIPTSLSPNPPKGCGHADVVRDEGGMNGWCGFDPYGFDRVWALEAHQWEVDDPGWR